MLTFNKKRGSMAHSTAQFERQLLKTRRLFLWDDISSDSARAIIQQIKWLWRKEKTRPLYLYIHSNGGDVDAESAIIDEIGSITADKGEVYTICNGLACSAAADILALGTPGCRYATPRSTIMMHAASCELLNDKIHEHKGCVDFYAAQREHLLKSLAKACGKGSGAKLKKFMEDVKNTMWLNTKDALKYGIVDDIWTPALEHSINPDEPQKEVLND
jgi:ATP-dependent Clp protease protease subunit